MWPYDTYRCCPHNQDIDSIDIIIADFSEITRKRCLTTKNSHTCEIEKCLKTLVLQGIFIYMRLEDAYKKEEDEKERDIWLIDNS